MDFVRNSKGANTGLKIFMISNEEHLRAICHLLFAKFLKNSLIMPVDFQTFQPHSLRKDFTSFGGALQGARDAQGSEFFRLFIRSQLYQNVPRPAGTISGTLATALPTRLSVMRVVKIQSGRPPDQRAAVL